MESKKLNEQNRNKLIDRENKWLPDGRGWGGGAAEKVEGIKKYLLSVTT